MLISRNLHKKSSEVSIKTRGAYHLTKNFEIFETGTNGMEISWESSRKSGNCWNSKKQTIQPKIPEIPGWKSNGTETSRKKFLKIWLYLTRLSSFPENYVNHWKFLRRTKVPESWQFSIFEGKTANGTGLSFSTPVQSTRKFWTIRQW